MIDLMGSVRTAARSRPLVLVVDDDPDISEALADALTLLGFRVETAPHGAAALAWLEGALERPSAIVLDLMMPVMDGEELGMRLHHDQRFDGIPIVVLTARSHAEKIAADIHAAAVLTKPVHLFLLKSAIADAIANQNAP
jgi:CheY-like chemotaxis protein